MKTLKLILSAIVLTAFFATQAVAQSAHENVKPLIDSQNYVFEAQWVLPMYGRNRLLTSQQYTVTVTKDSVIADLPYFGKAYVAPLAPSQAGISFTSTKFSYLARPIKNGWGITIQPKDNGSDNQLYFTIFNNGSATLHVNSSSRDGISFNGLIRARKQ